MKLFNELLTLSEAAKGTTLVGLTIRGQLITDRTKDEVWRGEFNCSRNSKLVSLEGAPKEIGGSFYCSNNPNLISLEGAPEKVEGSFGCGGNPKLTSLKGAPEKVGGYFTCADNPTLTSLEGAPKKVGTAPGGGGFSCGDNPSLTSLKGTPREIGGTFSCSNNPKLTSLKGIHKQVTSMGGKFFANNTPIKSHVLGLLLIKDCIGVKLDNKEVEAILNKYLPNTRGNKAVIECQSELLDADLEDFAEL